jgi:hypothetical protein
MWGYCLLLAVHPLNGIHVFSYCTKFMRLSIFITILASALLIASCLDPTVVGSDLLDQDRADIGFTDTINIKATTRSRDSILTYSPFTTSQLEFYLFGSFQDPVLGKATSTIYAQIIPESRVPRFGAVQPDSIVLILPYRRQNFYGNTDEPFAMEVVRLSERLVKDDDYFSNQSIALDPLPLASTAARPVPDSTLFIDYSGTDTIERQASFYRVPMPLSLAEELLGLDSTIYANDSLFFEAFKGLCLRPAAGSSNAGMMCLDLLSRDLALRAGLYLFYRDDENRPRRFLYTFSQATTVRLATFEHDYADSKALPFIDKPLGTDSLVFVQGMAGVEAILELPGIDQLRGLVVNKAELEIYVAALEEDDSLLYPPVSQLILSAPNSSGVLEIVEDIRIIQARRLSLPDFFGGRPTGGGDGEPMMYKMNISAHLQRVIDGVAGNTLVIAPSRGAETAARAVLYGPAHPQYGMKLKLAFTRL